MITKEVFFGDNPLYRHYYDIQFEYPIDREFQITIVYRQTLGNALYIITGRYTLKDLDYIRTGMINGSIKNDLDVFYRQLYSNFLRKFGKIREGFEVVFIDGETYSAKHKHELTLDSCRDKDYVDETYGSSYTFYVDDWTYYSKALDKFNDIYYALYL